LPSRPSRHRSRRPTTGCSSTAPRRTAGNNTLELGLDPDNAPALAIKFQIALPAAADRAPVVLQAIATASGVRDLLFVTTKAAHIVALDASTGAVVWSRQFAAPGCVINNGVAGCYTTSSPAIDPNRRYVYSYGLDGYVHKLNVADGDELTSGGWPELATLKGFDEKGSSALAIATANGSTYLYVTHGGYPGDNGDYQGHVTAIDLATGAQNVYSTRCAAIRRFTSRACRRHRPAREGALRSGPGRG
jgi:putative pyrroloquinoline-quinone binding quinoprotein